MFWFIAALALGSVIFVLTPEKAVNQADNGPSIFDKLSQQSLLILPLIILTWVIVAIVSAPMTPFAAAAIGFVLTAATVALPQLHKYLAPIAGLTFVSLLLELILFL
ncbi:hypothetical protein [Shewanella youngdeokensis]|uniref:Branched-chain amino acid ABC transporter n=1 Tax=Shewanella youngdeokensis TaxID=2999068 RepID=A0ABZ0K0P7_9GAMM|nr:hypothetical protein RGE70_04440 [Shewanella sp. DAU334]